MTYQITPDGNRYLAMGRGVAQPMPFHLRRGLPWLCRDYGSRWVVVNWCSIVLAAAMVGCLAFGQGATPFQSAVAAALFAGLPWVRFCAHSPVLVDMPGIALALLAAVLAPVNGYACGVALCAAAMVSEKAPVWAAVFAWNPVLLVGLVVPVCLRFVSRPAVVDPHDPLGGTLLHPFRTGLAVHAAQWRDPLKMLTPWGACLLVLTAPQIGWMWAAIAIGYAQLLVATDTVRLYQHAAPVVCVVAALAVPTAWAAPMLVAHWFNPWAGDGV